MTEQEPWTIGRLLQWTQRYLAQRDAESPRLDAEVLLAHARGCQRIELYTEFDTVADDDLREKFRELVRRRAAGTPVAYLVGSKEFYSLPFRVTPDVLIPRPETEFIVIRALDLAKTMRQQDPAKRVSVLDVGTGSGVLAICAAIHLEGSEVTAVDISEPALQVAQENAAAHGVADRIRFLKSGLLQHIPAGQKFDLILSNPPYVSNAEFDQLPAEVRENEPRQALVAGETGTEVIQALVQQAVPVLDQGGSLLVEVSPMIATNVQDLLRAIPRFKSTQITKDLAGHPRVVEAQV